MIKFFRKIRQKLLVENRFNKYLVYAVGEIVLVVIGILIALQINNWNEQRANEERIKTTLKQIQKDLINDIQEIEPIHKDINRYIELIEDFLYNNKPASYFEKKLGTLVFSVLSYDQFIQSNQSFLNFKNQISVVPSDYDNLMFNLNRLYIENAGLFRDSQNDLKNEITVYRSYLFKKYNWMEDYWVKRERTKEVKDYFLKSEDNRRQIVSTKYLLDYHQSLVGLIKSHSILCYLIIRDLLNDTSELPQVIKQFKLDYTENVSKQYEGRYKEEGNPQILKLEKKHGVLFLSFEDGVDFDVQFEGAMLQERGKDSLMWLLNNNYTLKFKRDSMNQVEGLYFFNIKDDKQKREKDFHRKMKE